MRILLDSCCDADEGGGGFQNSGHDFGCKRGNSILKELHLIACYVKFLADREQFKVLDDLLLSLITKMPHNSHYPAGYLTKEEVEVYLKSTTEYATELPTREIFENCMKVNYG